jgi:uncharacterized protein involved in exopolysaccharide biosynthesis
MNQNENLLGILATLYKWRKKIFLCCMAAAFLSVVISLFLSNYYKSTTVFYAASPDLAKPTPLGAMEGDKDFYGEEEDLDRLFSISSSSAVVDYLINKYNLYEHYDINPDSKKGPFKIREQFNKQYKTLKTKFGALQLSVEDTDPELAAQIANDARDKINFIAQKLIKESQAQLLETYKTNIEQKAIAVKTLSDSLYQTREKYSIYSTESQGQTYAELLAKTSSSLNDKKARIKVYRNLSGYQDSVQYLSAIVKGLENQQSTLNDQVQWFNKGLAHVMNLEFEQKDFAKQLSLDKERYKQLQAAYGTPFNGIHVVEAAEVPVIKSRPKRSIIVLGSLFAAFVLSVLATLFIESYRKLDWNKITNA